MKSGYRKRVDGRQRCRSCFAVVAPVILVACAQFYRTNRAWVASQSCRPDERLGKMLFARHLILSPNGQTRPAVSMRCLAAVDPIPLQGNEALSNVLQNIFLLTVVAFLVPNVIANKELLPKEECLPGRPDAIPEAPSSGVGHRWLPGKTLYPPFPEDTQMIMFGMGCFWCSENLFMRLPKGVYSTAVGYAGGVTPNPTYDEVCSGRTNHAEVVRVVYNPKEISCEELLQRFWEAHDPTTKNAQGNDSGTPYRSAVYYYNAEQKAAIEKSKEQYETLLKKDGVNAPITTEIQAAVFEFYYAEDYHQQYDVRPGNTGYCGLSPTGVTF